MHDHVREGQVLAGKYRVERVLGRGGMGVVVAARHLQLERLVALKFLLPEACSNPEAVARFLREGRAAVQIQGEHVARVTDVGTLEDGAPYLVMEYLNGQDLGAVLQARGPLPIAEAIGYVLQACEAIAEAHAAGIVHRDLKPANLFLARRPDGSALVKVLDFGISKATQAVGTENHNLTSTTAIMGSPLYMSPEQVRSSRDVDARSDIWSLGVILQELLAGAPPHNAATASALLASIVADQPELLRFRRRDAPPELEAIVLRCLQKDPRQRFANVAELSIALKPFGPREASLSVERICRILGSQPPASIAPPVPGAPPPVTGVTGARGWASTNGAVTAPEGVPKRSALGVIAAGLGAALVLGAMVGAVLWFRGRSTPTDVTASAAPEPPSAPAAAPPVPAPPSLPAPEPVVSVAPSESRVPPSASTGLPSKKSPAVSTARPKPPSSKVGAKPSRPKDMFDDIR